MASPVLQSSSALEPHCRAITGTQSKHRHVAAPSMVAVSASTPLTCAGCRPGGGAVQRVARVHVLHSCQPGVRRLGCCRDTCSVGAGVAGISGSMWMSTDTGADRAGLRLARQHVISRENCDLANAVAGWLFWTSPAASLSAGPATRSWMLMSLLACSAAACTREALRSIA